MSARADVTILVRFTQVDHSIKQDRDLRCQQTNEYILTQDHEVLVKNSFLENNSEFPAVIVNRGAACAGRTNPIVTSADITAQIARVGVDYKF
jgi:hypothetical protein